MDGFQFKEFSVRQERCAMKVGTDGVLLGAWASGGKRILDIGTGTGLIALMMAQRFAGSVVDAIDLDEAAVGQAQENVAASPFAGRIQVVASAVQAWNTAVRYDAIVSNPPFFADSLKAPDAQRSMARHTDTLSFGELMAAAARLLSDDGEVSVVVPADGRNRMDEAAVFAGLIPCRVCGVRTSERKPVKRLLLSYTKCPKRSEKTMMTIGDEQYEYLTKPFYLDK